MPHHGGESLLRLANRTGDRRRISTELIMRPPGRWPRRMRVGKRVRTDHRDISRDGLCSFRTDAALDPQRGHFEHSEITQAMKNSVEHSMYMYTAQGVFECRVHAMTLEEFLCWERSKGPSTCLMAKEVVHACCATFTLENPSTKSQPRWIMKQLMPGQNLAHASKNVGIASDHCVKLAA